MEPLDDAPVARCLLQTVVPSVFLNAEEKHMKLKASESD